MMGIATARTVKEDARQTRDRIDLRLRPQQKAAIEKAASMKGLTVTDFIVQGALENAQRTIREFETWTLEVPDAELFAEALAAPPSIGPRLTEAAQLYKEKFLQQ